MGWSAGGFVAVEVERVKVETFKKQKRRTDGQ
jgi:hypothetical protein